MKKKRSFDREKSTSRVRGGFAFPLVTIGVGTGSAEYAAKIIELLPTDSDMTFVVVQHLDQNQINSLVAILGESTPMRVHEAGPGMPLRPNELFVLPPQSPLQLHRNRFEVMLNMASLETNTLIDRFLFWQARNHRRDAVGIVISETEGEGSQGLQAIRTAGGLGIEIKIPACLNGTTSATDSLTDNDLSLSPEQAVNALTKWNQQYRNRRSVLAAKFARSRGHSLREFMEIAINEQWRIGQDLHDTAGQELTGLSYLAASLAESMHRQNLPEAANADRLVSGLENALQNVRTISKGLIPVDLGPMGIMSALQTLANETFATSNIPCQFCCDSDVLLEDSQMATQLFLIAREGVTNSVKHSQATKICVELSADKNEVVLKVSDDGVGLPDGPRSNGVGLRIMAYRTEAMNGTMQIERNEPQGTLLVFRVPLKLENAQ